MNNGTGDRETTVYCPHFRFLPPRSGTGTGCGTGSPVPVPVTGTGTGTGVRSSRVFIHSPARVSDSRLGETTVTRAMDQSARPPTSI